MSQVRPATPDDITALMAIDKELPNAGHWTEGQYRAALEPGAVPERVSLVVEDTAVIGFIVARVLGEEWEIENVAVRNQEQRRGIGSKLLQDVLSRARQRNARAIFLEVRESNEAARRLYAKSGFVPAGRRKGYYANPPEDALLFRYSFPQ